MIQRWSQYFLPTLKEVPSGTEAASHRLLLRAGCVSMLTSGVYSYLPLGLRVLRNVERIIEEEMDRTGAQQVFLSCLQPLELWQKTGRDRTLADVMITFEDNKGKAMCLGPTHEEAITQMVKEGVKSYRQLPVTLYQIQTKFRDEVRPRFGIVRACEFIMKDAYSFDRDKKGMKKSYDKMYEAYLTIFRRCGLSVKVVEADSGAMGGDVSHEFLLPAPIGEDEVEIEEGGRTKKVPAIELGHIFQLGTKYSEALEAVFLDEKGQRRPAIMGCYGIGVSRLLAAIIEVNCDDKGIQWPVEVAPFAIEVLPLQMDDELTQKTSREVAHALSEKGLDVLIDDREESPGRKFNDADLIGLPFQVVLGRRALQEGCLELKNRRAGESERIPIADAVSMIMDRWSEEKEKVLEAAA